MYSSQNLLNLGQMLKEKREDQGLSLQKISEWTKISVHTLQAIENAQVDQLPIYTYLRGFIIAYAKALEMDEKEVEKELRALAPPGENISLSGVHSSSSPAENLIEKDLHLTPVILAISILFILGSILVFTNVIKSYKKESTGGELVGQEQVILTEKQEETEDEETPDLDAESEVTKKPMEDTTHDQKIKEEIKDTDVSISPTGQSSSSVISSVEVVVKAVGEVKVSYQVDSEQKKEVSLREDQFEVLKGSKSIFIQTEDSDLIYIFHNGKNIGLFGTGGKKEKRFSPGDL